MSKKNVFRISFLNNGTVYEIYAKSVDQSEIFGFIEVEDIVFGETSSVVVDPSEERLKNEFQGVKCTLIPLHAILRIDMVEKEGAGKITVLPRDTNNISPFPNSVYTPSRNRE